MAIEKSLFWVSKVGFTPTIWWVFVFFFPESWLNAIVRCVVFPVCGVALDTNTESSIWFCGNQLLFKLMVLCYVSFWYDRSKVEYDVQVTKLFMMGSN